MALLSVLFNNMRTLNFKAQLRKAFSTAASLPFSGFKRSCSWVLIGGFQSTFSVSVFRSLFVVVVIITIDRREKCIS